MLFKENWFDFVANRQIRKSYFYWNNWANKQNKKKRKDK